MINKHKAQTIIDAAVSYGASRTSGIEVSITDSNEFTARFANNRMTEHVNSGGAYVSLRVLVNGRQARVNSDDLTLRGLKRSIDQAIALAKAAPLDKLMLALPKPSARTQLAASTNRFDARLLELSPDAREAAVKAMIRVADAYKLNAAGIYSASSEMAALGNSNGVFQFDKVTDVESSITMTARDSSGWAKGNGFSLDLVDPQGLAEIAARKAVMGKNPQRAQPGLWTVVLEPSAVLDLLTFVWDEFTGTAHVDRTSSFTDEIGEKVLGANITISDNVYHPLQSGFAFDDEGLARQAVTLVKNGVIGKPVMGRRTARALGFAPTGHGIMQPSDGDEEALNLVVEGGDSSVEKMIASTEHGLLVSRVWYCRPVDPNTNLLTGTTRDGLFLIEDGQVKHAVGDLRFNEGLLDLLNNVVELGVPILASGEEGFPAVVPPMKVRDFRFSSRV
jgi:predicted Zn-dependent protease